VRGLLLTAALLLAAPVHAEPKVVRFVCEIDDGRTRLLPRAKEEDVDDEMHCQATVHDLGGRSASDLVAEVSLLPATGPARVAATDKLSPTGRDGAELRALILPHATWFSAVDWRARPPHLRLVLRIYDKPSPGQKKWRLIATSRPLEVGGRKR
jgi:hypothetical protein